MLGKAHDAPLRGARNALEPLPVVERDGVSHAIRSDSVAGAIRNSDFDTRADIPLDEDVCQRTVRIHFLCVDHGALAAKGAEFPGGNRGKLAGSQCGVAQRQRPLGRLGSEHEREPCEKRRHQDGEGADGDVHLGGRDPAGERGGHFTVVIEAPERQNDAQEQPHRHENAQVLQRSEPDQLQHDALRKLVCRGALEHRGDLLSEQQDQQHACHDQPGGYHLSQYVTSEDRPQ